MHHCYRVLALSSFIYFFSLFFSFFPPSLSSSILLISARIPNLRGRVRIVPVDSGMGEEDWEVKYKLQGKNTLVEFLDREEQAWIEEHDRQNDLVRIEKACHDPIVNQLSPIKTKMHH